MCGVLGTAGWLVQEKQKTKPIVIKEVPPLVKSKKIKTEKIFNYSSLWEMRVMPEREVVQESSGPTPYEELIKVLLVHSLAYKGVSKENAFATIEILAQRKKKLVYIGDVFDFSESKWYRKASAPKELPEGAIITDYTEEGVVFLFKTEKVILPSKDKLKDQFQSGKGGKGGLTTSKKVSDNHWKIARTEQREVLKNAERYIKEAGLVPHYEKGKFSGVKLKKLPSNSLPAQRGLKKHDIVTKVNGVPIRSMEHLNSMIDQQKNRKRFVLNLTRLGKPMKLTFDIQ